MRIIVKKPLNKAKTEETEEKYRSDACTKHIGDNATIEYVRLNKEGTLCAAVDEDGYAKMLDANFFLSMNSPIPQLRAQLLVGPVVFVRHKYVNVFEEEIWDYEVEDLTEEDLKIIEEILSDTYQKKTCMQYLQIHHIMQ